MQRGETDTNEGYGARDMETAGAGVENGYVGGEAFVFGGAGGGGVLVVEIGGAGGAAVGEHVDEERGRLRR